MGFPLSRTHDLARCTNHPETKGHTAKMSRQHAVNVQVRNPKASITYSAPKTPMDEIPVPSFPRGRNSQGTVTVEVEPPFPHPLPGNIIHETTASTQVEPPFPGSRLDPETAAMQVEPPFPHPFPGNRVDPRSASMQVEPPFPHPFPGNRDGEVISAAQRLLDEVKHDIEATEKADEFNWGRDVTGTGRTSSSVRSDVRHKLHYYANPNKGGEYNHISGFLTPHQQQLNKIVQNVDELSQQIQRVSARLGDLRRQICGNVLTCVPHAI